MATARWQEYAEGWSGGGGAAACSGREASQKSRVPSDFVKANQAVEGPVVGGTGHPRPNCHQGRTQWGGVEGIPALTGTDDTHMSEEDRRQSRGSRPLPKDLFYRDLGCITGGGRAAFNLAGLALHPVGGLRTTHSTSS